MSGQMTEVVAALIERDGKILICRRPAHKARALLWEFAGGKTEAGETREQALIRECREELAVTVAPESVFAETVHTYPDLCVHLTVFRARIVQGEPQRLEHAELRWVAADEIASYAFCPADRAILEKIVRGGSAAAD